MIVSGITPADKRRSKVFLDGSFAFVLYNGEIKRFHIEEGEELAQELYSQIMDEVLCRRARERMLHLLKSTSRTELEIRRKLGVPSILSRLSTRPWRLQSGTTISTTMTMPPGISRFTGTKRACVSWPRSLGERASTARR